MSKKKEPYIDDDERLVRPTAMEPTRLDEFRDENGETHLWVGAHIDEEWRADLRLALQGDRLVVAEVRLYPRLTDDDLRARDDVSPSGWDLDQWALQMPGKPWKEGEDKGIDASVPAGGISARLLRRVPVHAHERMDIKPLGLPLPDGSIRELLSEGELLLRQYAQQNAQPRRGRPKTSDARFLKVARIYAAAAASGKPVRAVASELKIAPKQARDLVYRARQRGFLTQATWGRAGGQLTPEATALLGKVEKKAAPKKKVARKVAKKKTKKPAARKRKTSKKAR